MKRNNNKSTDHHHLARSIAGASGSNYNNSDNATISRNNRRNTLSDDPTTIPAHIMNLISSERETNAVSNPIPFKYPIKFTHIPSRFLYVKHLNHFNQETLTALFQYYGVIREYRRYHDFVLVRYQTLAMAERAKTSIVEEFQKIRMNIPIAYGEMVPTARVWIGGMLPNITENEIYNELEFCQYIVNITWSRNVREAEAYILYRYEDLAKRSVDQIYRRGCTLRYSQCPIRVGYTDICSFPFQHRNCNLTTEISDKCLTRIPTKLIMQSVSTFATLHFIAGDHSIAERLVFQRGFQLDITNIHDNVNINFDNLLKCPNSIFLGIFAPNQEQPSKAIISYLSANDSTGFSSTTIQDETFYSAILPPSYLSTYTMTYYFNDFLSNDKRNQRYIIVIVLRNLSPSIMRS